MNPGVLGGIIGSTVGVIGGIVGTYFSITRTNGPRERAFMIRWAAIMWIAIILFLALLIILPYPYRFLLWIPYGVLLPWSIIKINKGQAAIRKQERPSHQQDAEPT